MIIVFIIMLCLLGINVEKWYDTKYLPKSKRSRISNWLTKLGQHINTKVDHVIEKAIRWTTIESSGRRHKVMQVRLPRSRKRRMKAITVLSAMALQTRIGHYANNVRFDTDSAPVGIDNRCTACISHVAQDFIGPLRDSGKTIKGFAGSKTKGVKVGTLVWKWEDNEGKTSKFIIPHSYYVPEGKVRLLSPQHWAKSQQPNRKKITNKRHGTICQTTSDDITLMWNNRQSKLTVPLGADNNVATFHLACGFSKYDEFCMEAQVEDEQIMIGSDKPLTHKEVESQKGVWSKNIHARFLDGPKKKQSEDQDKEYDFDLPLERDKVNDQKMEDQDPSSGLLKLHHRFGHISFRKLQLLAKQGVIPKRYATCDIPVCAACMYGKMIRKQWRHKSTSEFDNDMGNVKIPGELVAVDQMVSPTPGFIAQITGKLTTKRYKYATVYVDIASRYGYVHLQTSPNTEETVNGKREFETHMSSMGVNIRAYQADNGIFKAHGWVNACKQKEQNLTFAGVNAHHQNGYAERRIRELQELARSMLIHANRKWPKTVTTNLWPYAIRMANDVYNNSPCFQLDDNISPMQILSGSNVSINVKHYRPFGCPAFVLNNALQQNKPHAKWDERARIGVYLGKSPHHNRNVALILNRETGLVSPQYHISYDEEFRTVINDEYDSLWKIKAGFVARQKPQQHEKVVATKGVRPTKDNNNRVLLPSEGGKDSKMSANVRKRRLTNDESTINEMHAQKKDTNMNYPKPKTVSWDQSTTTLNADGLRRSGRLNPNLVQAQKLISLQAIVATQKQNNKIPGELMCIEATDDEPMNKHILALKATTDPDTMYLHEALKEKDKSKFLDAMEKEVKDQLQNGNFTIMHIDDVPGDKTILPAVWQMKRKRDIRSREVKKYKARLNIDGSKMKKGVHYDQTYAPVASWNSIRVLLAMVAAKGWHTRQIDYVLAFPQAPVEKEIYMRIPKGFEVPNTDPKEYVLKLNRNVYGQKQAGRVWNKYLEDKLVNQLHFKQSKIDDCVFYRGSTMYVLYTDDSILAGPSEEEINDIIADIKSIGLDITEEGDIQDFLGIHIERQSDGTIKFSQPHLIDQILHDLKMDVSDLKLKDTPCKTSEVLKVGINSQPFDDSFHYRSIIGKLNYLEKGMRSDISYITHQCARYTESPKDIHAKAIRWLARYLKKTRTEGFMMKPDMSKGIEVYVDADFAGSWDRHDSLNPDTARSRHGYIIKVLGCPIVWKSQLQTEIALSSSESEYTGLSYALREAIPVMQLIREISELGFLEQQGPPKIYCEVFEDNSGALEMANIHKYRPRTKHLNVKLHHFRQYVNDGSVVIKKIDTAEQQADYLTKPLAMDKLIYLRSKVMGW